MSLRSGEHGRTFFDLLVEVVLITVGVFLALWANNWHEDREHRAQAQAALRNFAGEMELNRQATEHTRQYHETLARELHEFLVSKEPPTDDRFNKSVHFQGMRPVTFEHTAWDLALATQALSYLKPDLAFDISKVYTQQVAFQKLEDSFLSSAFTPAVLSSENLKGLAPTMEIYLVEINLQEPAIVSRYEQIIPEVKRALTGQGR
jgi:Tfp pilus assembly protein PilE